MIKYVLHPQWITSKNDGQRHFIGPKQLASLYRIPIAECIVAGDFSSEKENLIHLYPSYEGDYDIQANNNPARNLAREYTESLGDERLYNSTGEALDREDFLRWLIKKGYIAILEKPKETR
jgi:hypothetical protein